MDELEEITVSARKPLWLRHPFITAAALAGAVLLILKAVR